jgi:hypothetical protein
MAADALECFARAGLAPASPGSSSDGETRMLALRAYALTCRRLRRFGEAAEAWARILDLRAAPPAIAREAAEALAVHHEHRARNFEAAHQFALHTLALSASRARKEAVAHRLARLDRKRGGPSDPAGPASPPLF